MTTRHAAAALARRVSWYQLLVSAAAAVTAIGLPVVTAAFAWAQRIQRVETQVTEARSDSARLPELIERLTRVEEDVHWLRRDRERQERTR